MTEVNFGFRFHRNEETHNELLGLRRSLAQKFANDVDPDNPHDIDKLEFYPVERAGNSGSEVFYCDFYLPKVSFAKKYIAKFQSVARTNEEFNSARQAYNANLCNIPFKQLDEENDLGLIVYDLAGADHHEEFRGVFLNANTDSDICVQALSHTFKKVGIKPNSSGDRKTIFDDFSMYLDRDADPVGKMRSLVRENSAFESLGVAAENILVMLNKLEHDSDNLVFPYLVHGDLHARNLIVDLDSAETELIDFGWVHYGHPAKDFVLMEATLKYMLLPEAIQKNLKGKSSLSISSFTELESILNSNGFDLPELELCKRLLNESGIQDEGLLSTILRTYRCIVEIRRAAKQVLEQYCTTSNRECAFSEYNTCLFFVSLGMFGFAETEKFWVITGLNLLVNEISV